MALDPRFARPRRWRRPATAALLAALAMLVAPPLRAGEAEPEAPRNEAIAAEPAAPVAAEGNGDGDAADEDTAPAASTPTPAVAQTPPTATAPPTGFWSRTTLGGDWGGARSQLANDGMTVRLWATGFYQGQWSGDVGTFTQDGRGTSFLTGGRIDALFDLDTAKLGLWRGGGFHAHLELEGGRIPGFRGGALWPVNTGAILPLSSPEEVEATSLYYSQRWGGTSLLLGKINVIDLLANDPFFGGWGIDRFMNLAFVAPPSGVVPPVIMGGVLSQQIGEVGLSAMVFDPSDQTTNYGLDGLFQDGVNVSLSAQWNGRAFGRASNLGLTYTFSTQES
ncbi:MAG: hypothetical protein VKK97_08725, partial [Synechococcaceae cyanobacterium]|nr:hypothetical protein [Synechococcaceae cyanobacterium]